MSRKGVEEGRKCKKQALVQLFTKHGTRKGYINTAFTDINVALITYTLQGIFPP